MKKKHIQGLLAIGILGTMTLFFFKDSDKNELIIEDKEVAVNWYIGTKQMDNKWGEDLVSKSIKKLFNIDIIFESPVYQKEENISLRLAQEKLPDIITMDRFSDHAKTLIETERVISLNELDTEYKTNMLANLPQEVQEYNTYKDGNIYGYPGLFASETKEDMIYPTRMGVCLMRKDIYEYLDEPNISTPDTFIQTLKQIQIHYPEVQPVGFSEVKASECYALEELLQNLLGIPYMKEGKRHNRYLDEEYLRWIKTLNLAYNENLIPPDIFIDGEAQIKMKVQEGRYGIIFYDAMDLTRELQHLKENNIEYIAVDGPRSQNGNEPIMPINNGVYGEVITFVSKESLYKQEIAQLIDYMGSTEGQQKLYLGEPVLMWKERNNTYYATDRMLKLRNERIQEYDNIYGGAFKYWMISNIDEVSRYRMPITRVIEQPYEWYKKYSQPTTVLYPEYYNYLNHEYSNEDEIRRIESLVELITAKGDSKYERLLESYKEIVQE